jgi:hypothetical protein
VRIYLLYALIVSIANHHFFAVFHIYSSGVAYLMFYLFIIIANSYTYSSNDNIVI